MPRPPLPDERAARRRRAAKRSRRRTVLARNIVGDDERREWLDAKMLRPGEVAMLFQVNRRTVCDWAKEGRIPFILTPGGHRRFRARDVRKLIGELTISAVRTDR